MCYAIKVVIEIEKYLMPKVQLSITINPELCREARILASIEGKKMSELSEKAIEQYVRINRQKILDYYQNHLISVA